MQRQSHILPPTLYHNYDMYNVTSGNSHHNLWDLLERLQLCGFLFIWIKNLKLQYIYKETL